MMTALKIAGAICLVAFAGYRLHLWLIKLEERGYIYYRTKSRGSGSGVFFEIDKLTRPSIENTQKAMDLEVESQTNEGE